MRILVHLAALLGLVWARSQVSRRFRARNVVETERDLKNLFPEESWNTLHLQIIFFGREHCPARGHDLEACAICGWAATKARIREEKQRQRRRTK